MATDPVGALIDGHVVPGTEQPGRRQSRNAGAHDRNLETHIVSHI
jgi:hypothetical protein